MMHDNWTLNSLNFTVGVVSLLMVVMFYERLIPDNAVTLFMNEHPVVVILGVFLFIPGYVGTCIWLDNGDS
jgi:uncharacterized membrane protein